MFGWLFGRGRSRQAIFAYHDGTRRRWADPVAAYARLDEKGGEKWPELFETTTTAAGDLLPADSPVRADLARRKAEATKQLCDLTRYALGVPAFDDATGRPVGLTQAAVMELLLAFLDFCRRLAEDARPFGSRPSQGSHSPAA